MDTTRRYVFRPDTKENEVQRHADSPSEREPYVAGAELITAVNLAIYLRRPLLLEGEAGCGKTRLARAVAYELGLPYYPWYVRSTTKAQDGFYTYDAILRLHDVHLAQLTPLSASATVDTETLPRPRDRRRDPRNSLDYRTLGPLGKAFDQRDYPAVVLIDEIDKADLDFPNDLLTVLDDPWEFYIPETGEVKKAAEQAHPIVIITSNKEKGNLPAPFLRRCIYHYISFPGTEELLKEIVEAHHHLGQDMPESNLFSAAASQFLKLRTADNLFKAPGTSEFLDWLQALSGFDNTPYSSEQLRRDASVPYPEVLFKMRADFQRNALQP